MQDDGMESGPRTQAAPEPPLAPEAAPGHRLLCIWKICDRVCTERVSLQHLYCMTCDISGGLPGMYHGEGEERCHT